MTNYKFIQALRAAIAELENRCDARATDDHFDFTLNEAAASKGKAYMVMAATVTVSSGEYGTLATKTGVQIKLYDSDPTTTLIVQDNDNGGGGDE